MLRKAEELRARVSFILFVWKNDRLVQSRLCATGFDGIVLERENRAQPREGDLAEQRPRKYKAYLCASVTTEDEAALKSAYDEEMDKTFSKLRSERRKRVYKSAHLAKQLKEGVDEFIPTFCESLSDHIAELRIYFCYLDRPFVAAYGRGHGERFHPRDFIDKNQDLLLHVCALFYAKESERPEEAIQMDHFDSHTTPAWRSLTKLGRGLEIYYSGGECNALVSLADQVLRIIELHQYGWVDPSSILRPIREHLPQVSKKLKFNDVGKSDEEMNLLKRQGASNRFPCRVRMPVPNRWQFDAIVSEEGSEMRDLRGHALVGAALRLNMVNDEIWQDEPLAALHLLLKSQKFARHLTLPFRFLPQPIQEPTQIRQVSRPRLHSQIRQPLTNTRLPKSTLKTGNRNLQSHRTTQTQKRRS